uniref:Uncharacterized protein n=1 Tax=Aureoumbra lagunensis TaxID=44058 RepID=A0A7S3JSS1_9STRA|mmetsp:Transcript_6758/g.9456  ORF Transcript_6758/g.9456 Transcript_6758/m.9456 type:complete len:678 (+) Transcript_6758:78-2111(+)
MAPNRRCKEVDRNTKCKFDKNGESVPVLDRRTGQVKPGRWKFRCRVCTHLSIYEFDICDKCGQFRNRHKKKKHDLDECPARVQAQPNYTRALTRETEAAIDAQIESYYIPKALSPPPLVDEDEDEDVHSIISHMSSFTEYQFSRCRTRAESECFDNPTTSDEGEQEPIRQRRRTESQSPPSTIEEDDCVSLEDAPLPFSELLSLSIVDAIVGPVTTSTKLQPDNVWWQDHLVSLSLVIHVVESEIRKKLMDVLEPDRHHLLIELPREETWVTKHVHRVFLEEKILQGEKIILRFFCFVPKVTFFRQVKCFPVSSITGTATLALEGINAISEPITFYSQVTDEDWQRAQHLIISLTKSLGNKGVSSSTTSSSNQNCSETTNANTTCTKFQSNQLCAADRALAVMARKFMSAGEKYFDSLEELALQCGFEYLLHELVSKRLGPTIDSLLSKRLNTDPGLISDIILSYLGCNTQKPRLWAVRRIQTQARRYISSRKSFPKTTRLMVLIADLSYFSSLRFTQQSNSFDFEIHTCEFPSFPFLDSMPYLIVWSSATKENISMERQERRLCQLLQAKKKLFEIVYVDLTPDRKRQLQALCKDKKFTLPALSLGYSIFYGSFDFILEQVDRGSFDSLTATAHNAVDSSHCGFWVKPQYSKCISPPHQMLPSSINLAAAPQVVAF